MKERNNEAAQHGTVHGGDQMNATTEEVFDHRQPIAALVVNNEVLRDYGAALFQSLGIDFVDFTITESAQIIESAQITVNADDNRVVGISIDWGQLIEIMIAFALRNLIPAGNINEEIDGSVVVNTDNIIGSVSINLAQLSDIVRESLSRAAEDQTTHHEEFPANQSVAVLIPHINNSHPELPMDMNFMAALLCEME
jgi:hypothetical protein